MPKDRIEEVLKTLTYREREIIKLRYGLGDGYSYTLEEVGHIFKVTRERIRQIEAKAVRKLQQPYRSRPLLSFLDGANVEIRSQVGEDNIFIFGLTAERVQQLRRRGYDPRRTYESNAELKRVIDMIGGGYFSPEEPARYHPLMDSLLGAGGDHYLVLADYPAYLDCSDAADRLYRDASAWDRCAVINTAMMGYFSSDRTIRDYQHEIWRAEYVRVRGKAEAGERGPDTLDSVRGSRQKYCHDAGLTQLVECQLPKLNVAGSSPVSRSDCWRKARRLGKGYCY